MTDGSEGMRGRYRDRGSRTGSKQICYWKRVKIRDRTLVNETAEAETESCHIGRQ